MYNMNRRQVIPSHAYSKPCLQGISGGNDCLGESKFGKNLETLHHLIATVTKFFLVEPNLPEYPIQPKIVHT